MITVLTGANVFMRLQKLAALKADFGKKYGYDQIERVSGEELTVADLPSLLQGGSLFSSNRMVVIRNLSSNKEVAEKFLEYCEKVPEDTHVILVEGQIDKRSSFYKTLKKLPGFKECSELSEGELLKWIVQYTEAQKGSITPSVARTLLEYAGLDQQRLASELEKLVAYDPQVTGQSINELVEKRPQTTVFQLLEYALSGQHKRALETLRSLERAFEDPYQIANLLIWQVQVMAVVKSAGSRGDSEIAKETKFNPYVVSKTKRLARGVDQNKMNTIINKTAELDLSLKSTGASPWRTLEYTVAAL